MTRKQARTSLHKTYNPCVVLMNPGDRIAEPNFDAFPAGHPIPAGAMIVERLKPTAAGRGRWEAVDTLEDFLNRLTKEARLGNLNNPGITPFRALVR